MERTKIITAAVVENSDYECSIMPCRIKYTGFVKDEFSADKKYWNITTPEQDDNGKVLTYFRGRELNGKQIDLSLKGFQGFVMSKEDNTYKTIGKFDKLNNFYNGNDANNCDELVEEWLYIAKLLN